MVQVFLLKTSVLFFGSLLGYRILKIIPERKIIFEVINKKQSHIVIFLIFGVCGGLWISSFLVWMIYFLLFLSLIVTIFVTGLIFEKKFRQDFVFYLDKVILKMKMGLSLRASLEDSLDEMSLRFQKILRQILEIAYAEEGGKITNYFHLQIYNEIRSWLGQSSRILSRMISFRRILRKEDLFRRKSDQIYHQIKMQIILLALMYTFLLLFIFQKFPIQNYFGIYLVSFLLFLIGILTIYIISRRQSWRI